jgi:hypothetical protein
MRAILNFVAQLPVAIRRCQGQLFWDVDPDALSLDSHGDFIIGRVLTYGDESAVRALAELVGNDALRDFTLRAPHRLDRRSRRFFEVLFTQGESACTTMPSRPCNDPLFVP